LAGLAKKLLTADGVECVAKIYFQKGDRGVGLKLVDDSLCGMNNKRCPIGDAYPKLMRLKIICCGPFDGGVAHLGSQAAPDFSNSNRAESTVAFLQSDQRRESKKRG
jgi:hypothetical protein